MSNVCPKSAILRGVYTVGRTAELTGVPRETLRKWEQRYGVVDPVRTEGNYRLYDDESVRRLSVMRDLVDAGWSPKEAARHVLGAPVATPPAGEGGPAPLDELARCAERFDLDRVEQVLDEAFARTDLDVVVDDWLMPSLVRLGEAWQGGQVTIAGEHFISAAVHRRLAYAFQQLAAPGTDAPKVAVGLARGSRHELGVLSFAAVLRSQGVGVTYLGSDLPLEAWIETVRTLGPDAVVIGVPTVEDLPAVREVVSALARRGLVLVGGAHQDRVEGAEPLGHAAGAAARDLAARLRG